MSAILFIPATAGIGRRIDLVEIARRFAEPDEAAPRPARHRAARLGLLLLILLGVSADFVLVARSGAVDGCLSSVPAPPEAHRAA